MNSIFKKSKLLLFILTCLVIIASCENDRNEVIDNPYSEQLTVFKSNFPDLYTNISIENVQESKTDNENKYASKSSSNSKAITFPIVENEKIVGRYFGLSDESASFYLDFFYYKTQVTVYDVNYPFIYEMIEMEYDSETNFYIPKQHNSSKTLIYAKSKGWCAISCGIGGIAIALSDGPFPVMDLLAVSYTAACLTACE